MPLDWTQVRAGLDPKRFTVRTTPALLAKPKARKNRIYCLTGSAEADTETVSLKM
jgi:bifunctional non-homologous end joining protein LigD